MPDLPRVVSLLSSCTEWVCVLGAEASLVGRSHECDHPDSVRRLPECSRPLVDIHASSAEIDRQVKERRRNALSIYEVDEVRLAELRPDLVLTQTQCEVCAVSLADVEQALGRVTGGPTRVVSVHPTDLASVFDDGRRIARSLGIPEEGERVLAELRNRLERLREESAAKLRDRGGRRPRVLCLEWIEPPMASGNWMPELVEIVSGESVAGGRGHPSPWLGAGEVARLDPDAIVVLPCGWDLDRTTRELGPLARSAEWRGLRAVREGRVALADGNRFFNRPGPRLIESAEILAEILWSEPDVRGRFPDWRRVSPEEWTGWE